jgi:hypothetical protein
MTYPHDDLRDDLRFNEAYWELVRLDEKDLRYFLYRMMQCSPYAHAFTGFDDIPGGPQ